MKVGETLHGKMSVVPTMGVVAFTASNEIDIKNDDVVEINACGSSNMLVEKLFYEYHVVI